MRFVFFAPVLCFGDAVAFPALLGDAALDALDGLEAALALDEAPALASAGTFSFCPTSYYRQRGSLL